MSGRFVLTRDAGMYRFRLTAANGATLAVSREYMSKASALHGIESVRRHAPDARLVDLTRPETCGESSPAVPGA
ncbi:MAG TPA: DUF1508 domain-containing protein [Pseudonocardiaceae bacterium]|nr:DUF1508 domain-containing protein [Pseudonocardiaceae bacterium]